jgi:hypothetical protein
MWQFSTDSAVIEGVNELGNWFLRIPNTVGAFQTAVVLSFRAHHHRAEHLRAIRGQLREK